MTSHLIALLSLMISLCLLKNSYPQSENSEDIRKSAISCDVAHLLNQIFSDDSDPSAYRFCYFWTKNISFYEFSVSPEVLLTTVKDNNTENKNLDFSIGVDFEHGKFKVPSLRNLKFTARYMHDGRFNTLDEVLDFYSNGIHPHSNLDPRLRDPDGGPKLLDMNQAEKAAVKAFLLSLTVEDVINQQLYADPFTYQ